MKKRIASLLMVAAMLLSLAANALAVDVPQPTAQGEAAVSQFHDVSTTYWAYSGIRDVVSRGLYQGTSQTTFEPDKNMSRAQFVIVLARFDGRGSLENQRAATGFSDVPEDFWAAGAIAWAASSNIVLGYGGENGTNVFYPNRTISRAQIAALVYRYLNYKGYNLPAVASPVAPFTDMGIVPDVFVDAVEYCRTRDLLRGYEDGSLRPNANVTRAQVATILSRMIAVLENVDVTPTTTPSDGTVNLSAGSYQNGTTTWREENGNIYLTVTPNAGYIVESVTAVDALGNRLAVTRLPNGEYMFAKPTALPVTVTVVYDIDTTAYYSFTAESNTNGNSSRVTLVERGSGSRWEEVARRDSDGHLTFVNGYNDIQVGDRLTVSHIANDGYRFSSIRITNSNGRNVATDRRNNDTTRFTLPSATPVLIDVEYRTGSSRSGSGGGGGGGGGGPSNPTPSAETITFRWEANVDNAHFTAAVYPFTAETPDPTGEPTTAPTAVPTTAQTVDGTSYNVVTLTPGTQYRIEVAPQEIEGIANGYVPVAPTTDPNVTFTRIAEGKYTFTAPDQDVTVTSAAVDAKVILDEVKVADATTNVSRWSESGGQNYTKADDDFALTANTPDEIRYFYAGQGDTIKVWFTDANGVYQAPEGKTLSVKAYSLTDDQFTAHIGTDAEPDWNAYEAVEVTSGEGYWSFTMPDGKHVVLTAELKNTVKVTLRTGGAGTVNANGKVYSAGTNADLSSEDTFTAYAGEQLLFSAKPYTKGGWTLPEANAYMVNMADTDNHHIPVDDVSSIESGTLYWTIPDTAEQNSEYTVNVNFAYNPRKGGIIRLFDAEGNAIGDLEGLPEFSTNKDDVSFSQDSNVPNYYTTDRLLKSADADLEVTVALNSAESLEIDLDNPLYTADTPDGEEEPLVPADFMAEWAYGEANTSFLFAYYAVEDSKGNYVVPVTVVMPSAEPTTAPTDPPTPPEATYDIVFAACNDPAVTLKYTFNLTFADDKDNPQGPFECESNEADGRYSVPLPTDNNGHKPDSIQITNVEITGRGKDGKYSLDGITDHYGTSLERLTGTAFSPFVLNFKNEGDHKYVVTLTPHVTDMTGKYSVKVMGLVFDDDGKFVDEIETPSMTFTLKAGDATVNYATGLTPNMFDLGTSLKISSVGQLPPYELLDKAPTDWQTYVDGLGADTTKTDSYARIFAIQPGEGDAKGTIVNLETTGATIDDKFLEEDSTELTVYVMLKRQTVQISAVAEAYTDESITDEAKIGTMSIYTGPFDSDDPNDWTSADNPAKFTRNETKVVRVVGRPTEGMKIDSFRFEDASGNEITDITETERGSLLDEDGNENGKYTEFTYNADRDITVVGLFSKEGEMIFKLKAEGEGGGEFEATLVSSTQSILSNGSSVSGNVTVKYENGRFSKDDNGVATIDSAGNAMFVMREPASNSRAIVTVRMTALYDTTLLPINAEEIDKYISGAERFTLKTSTLANNAADADKFEYSVSSDNTYRIAWPAKDVEMTVHYTVKQYAYAIVLDANVGNVGTSSVGTPFVTTGLGKNGEDVTFQDALNSLFENTPDDDFPNETTYDQDGVDTLERYLAAIKDQLKAYGENNTLEITNSTLVEAGISSQIDSRIREQVKDIEAQLNDLVTKGTADLANNAKADVEQAIIEELAKDPDLALADLYGLYKNYPEGQAPAPLQESYDTLLKYLFEPEEYGGLEVVWDDLSNSNDPNDEDALKIEIEGQDDVVQSITDYAIGHYKVLDAATKDKVNGHYDKVTGVVEDAAAPDGISPKKAVEEYINDETADSPKLEFKVSVYGSKDDDTVSLDDYMADGIYLAAHTNDQSVGISVKVNSKVGVSFNGKLGFKLRPEKGGDLVETYKDANGATHKLQVTFTDVKKSIDVNKDEVRVVDLGVQYADIGQVMTTEQLEKLDSRVKNRYPDRMDHDVQQAFDAIYVPQGQQSTASDTLVVAHAGDPIDGSDYSTLRDFTVNGLQVVKLEPGSGTGTAKEYKDASKLKIDLETSTWLQIFPDGIDKAFDLKAALTRYYSDQYTDWMVGRLNKFGIGTKNIDSPENIAAALQGTAEDNSFKDLYLKDVFRKMYNYKSTGDVDDTVFSEGLWKGYEQQIELTWNKSFDTDAAESQIGAILQGVFGNPNDDTVSVTGKLIIARRPLDYEEPAE